MYTTQVNGLENRFAERKAILGLESTKRKIDEIVNRVNKENFEQYTHEVSNVLSAYKANGGLGQPIYDYMNELDEIHSSKDACREELLVESLCRITGLTAPEKRIIFKDFDPKQQVWN